MGRQGSLARPDDFRRVMRAGVRIRTNGVSVYCSPSPAGESRLGMAVRARSAVTRNRIKRRLRAAYRSAAPADCDVVVRASEDAVGVPFQELVDILERAAGRPRLGTG